MTREQAIDEAVRHVLSIGGQMIARPGDEVIAVPGRGFFKPVHFRAAFRRIVAEEN